MTSEALRIALAKVDGWKSIKRDTVKVYCDDTTEPGDVTTYPIRAELHGFRQEVPDYENDWNALQQTATLIELS